MSAYERAHLAGFEKITCGRVIKIRPLWDTPPERHGRGKKGPVRGWTKHTHDRFYGFLHSVDWDTFLSPVMISLDFVIDHEISEKDVDGAKRALRSYIEWLARPLKKQGARLKMVGTMEFQKRSGAPHFLIFADVPLDFTSFESLTKRKWCELIGQTSGAAIQYAANIEPMFRSASGDLFPIGYMWKKLDDPQLRVPASVGGTGIMWFSRGIRLEKSVQKLSVQEGLTVRRLASRYKETLPWNEGSKVRVPSTIRTTYVVVKGGGNFIARLKEAVDASRVVPSTAPAPILVQNQSGPQGLLNLPDLSRTANPFPLGDSSFHHTVDILRKLMTPSAVGADGVHDGIPRVRGSDSSSCRHKGHRLDLLVLSSTPHPRTKNTSEQITRARVPLTGTPPRAPPDQLSRLGTPLSR